MRIYLEIETKKRELDSRIYFAVKAANKGYPTVFGKKSRLIEKLDYLAPGVFILKSGNKRAAELSKTLRKKNFIPFASDEEGAIIMNYIDTGKRVSIDCLNNIESYFSWGKDEKNAILKNYTGVEDKIIEVGNCRMDILKDPLRKIYINEAEIIKKKYGSFILYTSAFHKYNAILDDNSKSWVEYMTARGVFQSNDFDYYKEIVKYQEINMKKTINFFKEYSRQNIDKIIIVRPHPAENFDNWKSELSNLKNVKFIFDDLNTNSWILASDMMISYNCTTLLEAYLLGKEPINLVFDQSELTKFKLTYLVSKKITQNNEMFNEIKKMNFISETGLNRKQIDEKLTQIIHNSNENCAADDICNFLMKKKLFKNDNQKDKFSNRFFFCFFYFKRFIKSLIHRSSNSNAFKLSNQKNPGINFSEVREKVKLISNLTNIHNVYCDQIYPGVFMIKKK